MHRHIAMLILAGLVAAGCAGNSTEGMDVPVVASPPLPPAPTASPLFPARDDRWKSLRLERVIVDLPRGSVIAHYPHRFWKKWQYSHICNVHFGPDASIAWGTGTGNFGNWTTEAGRIFFDVMRRRGMNVVGDISEIFETGERARSAELLIGGRITEIRGNICHRHQFFTERRLHQYLGEFHVKVQWEVFSSLSRRIVYRFQTEGYFETSQPRPDGIMLILLDAFETAVVNASYDDGLVRLLARDTDPRVIRASHDQLTVTGRGRYHRPINGHLAEIAEAAVTIELGTGHGSAFLISRDGHLLTNAHVVGNGKTVPVVFRNGVRVNGSVVQLEPRRDVALVKVPVAASYILPIRQDKPRIGDDVYVVGSPSDPSLRSTVTKGIVSAFRTIDGQDYIQSDAAVTAGNSGGPLLDAQGNVIGLTVMKVRGAENLNLFIPIDDALKALNLTVATD